MYLSNQTVSDNPICSGCGKKITSYRRIYKSDVSEPLIFCKTCCKHIDKRGGIFFTNYSNDFDMREQIVSKIY